MTEYRTAMIAVIGILSHQLHLTVFSFKKSNGQMLPVWFP